MGKLESNNNKFNSNDDFKNNIYNDEFKIAAVEVLEILKHVEEEEVKKIDKTFINMLIENKDKNYEFKIDDNTEFDKLNITDKTNDLLAYIYRKYWANEEEKIEFDKKILENEKNFKTNIKKKDDKFQEIVEIKRNKNIFKKIVDWIKNKFV